MIRDTSLYRWIRYHEILPRHSRGVWGLSWRGGRQERGWGHVSPSPTQGRQSSRHKEHPSGKRRGWNGKAVNERDGYSLGWGGYFGFDAPFLSQGDRCDSVEVIGGKSGKKNSTGEGRAMTE
jgi:hypothetical protein